MKSLVFAITGANGQIGSYFVDYLRKKGNVVYELVRSPDKAKDKQYYRYFDLSELSAIPVLNDIDVLIHTAHYFDTTDQNYRKINVIGTKALFEKAKKNQVNFSIFISSISTFSNAQSLYGRTKYEIEECIKDENVIIVRPGLVLNQPLKGIAGAMDRFIQKSRFLPLIGNGRQQIYICFLNELTHLIFILSLSKPVVNNPIIAATEKGISFKQLLKSFASQQQKKIMFLPVPFYMAFFTLKVLEWLKLFSGLRSDSLLGLQFVNKEIDFSETKNRGFTFSGLNIE